MLYRHKTKASKPFQLTAARRRLDSDQATPLSEVTISTHSRPKAAGTFITDSKGRLIVSTHSRPKAAGIRGSWLARRGDRFNSQPPEGGWKA